MLLSDLKRSTNRRGAVGCVGGGSGCMVGGDAVGWLEAFIVAGVTVTLASSAACSSLSSASALSAVGERGCDTGLVVRAAVAGAFAAGRGDAEGVLPGGGTRVEPVRRAKLPCNSAALGAAVDGGGDAADGVR